MAKLSEAKSKKKTKKKGNKKAGPDSISMKLKATKWNPFETIWSRRKFDILGKKRKGEERRLGLARSLAIQKAFFTPELHPLFSPSVSIYMLPFVNKSFFFFFGFRGRKLCWKSMSRAQSLLFLWIRELESKMMTWESLRRLSCDLNVSVRLYPFF